MPRRTPQSRSSYEVSSVRKALEILCAFRSEAPSLTVTELSRRVDIPKSTAHNLLRTLQRFDFITQDPESRMFRLGPRLFELGMQLSEAMQVAAVALPHLRALMEVTRETAKLAILSDGEALIVAAAESPHQLHTRGDAGKRAPLHCTGIGKALLATMRDAELRDIAVRRGLPASTRQTITSLSRLEKEVSAIRSAGYAYDNEESEDGVRCVAAAIPESVAGGVSAISISGPALRITDARLPALAEQVRGAARAISDALRSMSTRRAAATVAAPAQACIEAKDGRLAYVQSR